MVAKETEAIKFPQQPTESTFAEMQKYSNFKGNSKGKLMRDIRKQDMASKALIFIYRIRMKNLRISDLLGRIKLSNLLIFAKILNLRKCQKLLFFRDLYKKQQKHTYICYILTNRTILIFSIFTKKVMGFFHFFLLLSNKLYPFYKKEVTIIYIAKGEVHLNQLV